MHEATLLHHKLISANDRSVTVISGTWFFAYGGRFASSPWTFKESATHSTA